MKIALNIVVFVFTSASSLLCAQNLIPNPSFEQYNYCPTSFLVKEPFHKLVKDWTSPTLGTPDYFNKCSNGSARIPDNWAGIAQPKNGAGYVGIYTWSETGNIREYLQVQLKTPLESGVRYRFVMHYCLSTYSRYACDDLGVLFSKTKLDLSINDTIFQKPQIVSTGQNTTDNELREWQKVTDSYKALGGEEYLVIGNFYSRSKSKAYFLQSRAVQNPQLIDKAYYYIDDLSLEKVENGRDTALFVNEKPFTFNNLLFEYNSAKLVDTVCFEHLRKLAFFVQNNPALALEIIGHTDSIGGADFNKRLSLERATTIANVLVLKGLKENKIKVLNLGSSTPVSDNTTETGRKLNRRVDFVIMSK